MRSSLTCTLAWVGVLSATPSFAGTLPEYTVTIIETFPEATLDTANAVNNRGQVSGYSNLPFTGLGKKAWVWEEGRLTDIGNLGGNTIDVRDINEQGHVAGYGNNEDLDWRALVYIDGAYLDLPTLGGPGVRAFGINERGQVVGDAQIPLPLAWWRAVLYEDDKLIDLGTLGGGNSLAYAINNDGVIVGTAANSDIDLRAVKWIDREIMQLEHPDGWSTSVAYGINQAGDIVGTFGEGLEIVYPAMWIDGELVELETLPFNSNATPWSINENRMVAGWTRFGDFLVRATVWIDGEIHLVDDLLPFGSLLQTTYAWDVNDHGWIVGQGFLGDVPHAYVLKPVIEQTPGDLDDDGDVDFADLLALLNAWGPCNACPEDLDASSAVGFSDLLLLLANWS